MTTSDPTDPAAEIKYLKALERAKWPEDYPDPAKAKKWPAAADAAKVNQPRIWKPVEAEPPAAVQMGGMSLSEIVRALLAIGAAVGVALLID